MIKLSQRKNIMKTFFHQITIDHPDLIMQDALFIDIETTGLSSQKHFIYCIGTAYRSGDQLSILQWIAENRSEETNVLNAFLQLLHKQHFKTILTFNGRTFDLPFIEKRHFQVLKHYYFVLKFPPQSLLHYT